MPGLYSPSHSSPYVNFVEGWESNDVQHNVEQLRTGGPTMIHGLHAVITAVWQFGNIHLDWRME